MNTETKKVLRWVIYFILTQAAVQNARAVWGDWWPCTLPAILMNFYAFARLAIWLWNSADNP